MLTKVYVLLIRMGLNTMAFRHEPGVQESVDLNIAVFKERVGL